jgi:hypothetical protein
MRPAFLWTPPQLFKMPFETFNLGKKASIEVELIQNPDRIMVVDRCYQFATNVPNCFQMAGRDVAAHSDDCEIFTHIFQFPPTESSRYGI